ncbi:MAG: ABC transporter permease [Bacilli bacterium]|nr:ABC transporter permease [Bacilli bacterium]
MLRYTIKRIILIFVTLFIILTLCYVLIQFTTSFDKRVLVYRMSDPNMKAEDAIQYAVDQGWGDPIPVKYFNWLKGVVKGDWGVSVVYEIGQNPWVILTRFIPFTMSINIWSLLISIPLGFLFGIIAALRKNKPTDYLISLFVIIFISVPSFVVVTFLMINASKVGLPTQFSPSDQVSWKDYVIPVMALSFGPIATLTRYTRAELTEVLTSEYLLLARTKGLNRFQATIRHALRNSMVPLVPMIISNFVGIMFGSLVIEQIYGVKGVGGILLNSINETRPDHDLAMAALAFYTIIGLATTLVVDLSYGLVDPRIRMGAR